LKVKEHLRVLQTDDPSFGDEYRRYMADVPGFIPHVSRLLGVPAQKKYGNG
jgi:hypothetical protein